MPSALMLTDIIELIYNHSNDPPEISTTQQRSPYISCLLGARELPTHLEPAGSAGKETWRKNNLSTLQCTKCCSTKLMQLSWWPTALPLCPTELHSDLFVLLLSHVPTVPPCQKLQTLVHLYPRLGQGGGPEAAKPIPVAQGIPTAIGISPCTIMAVRISAC